MMQTMTPNELCLLVERLRAQLAIGMEPSTILVVDNMLAAAIELGRQRLAEQFIDASKKPLTRN